MIYLCCVSGDFMCPGTTRDAILGGSAELNALVNLSNFPIISYFLFSLLPTLSFIFTLMTEDFDLFQKKS